MSAKVTLIVTQRERMLLSERSLESILADPHLVATNFFPVVEHPSEGPIRSMRVSATWSDTPATPERLAPRLSEHSEEILREAGFTADEIAGLIRDGVTKPATAPQD